MNSLNTSTISKSEGTNIKITLETCINTLNPTPLLTTASCQDTFAGLWEAGVLEATGRRDQVTSPPPPSPHTPHLGCAGQFVTRLADADVQAELPDANFTHRVFLLLHRHCYCVWPSARHRAVLSRKWSSVSPSTGD